jgi:hypothetical protein
MQARPRGEQAKVQAFLKELLKYGPVDAKYGQQEAQRQGFTDSQIKTARVKLGIESKKDKSVDGGWIWSYFEPPF